MGVLDQAAPIKITDVRARIVNVPLRRPLIARVARVDFATLLLVDVETAAGVAGHAYIHAFPAASARAFRGLIAAFAEIAVGHDLAPAALHDTLTRRIGIFVGIEGMFISALAGVDMACWDALAKVNGTPLARLLGGKTDRLPAYNSTGLGLATEEHLRTEAPQLLERGFTGLKMRLGNETLAEDIGAVRAIRNVITDGVSLMSDCGQSLTTVEAIRRGRALDGEGLYWIEDPVVYHDLGGHARIANEIATPVQTGENLFGPHRFAEALAAGAADYMNLDLQHIGGITGWMRAAEIAAAAGMRLSSHIYPEFSIHALAATPTAHWLEYFDWADAVLAEPLVVQHGMAMVPEGTGAGVAWNEFAVARYLA